MTEQTSNDANNNGPVPTIPTDNDDEIDLSFSNNSISPGNAKRYQKMMNEASTMPTTPPPPSASQQQKRLDDAHLKEGGDNDNNNAFDISGDLAVKTDVNQAPPTSSPSDNIIVGSVEESDNNNIEQLRTSYEHYGDDNNSSNNSKDLEIEKRKERINIRQQSSPPLSAQKHKGGGEEHQLDISNAHLHLGGEEEIDATQNDIDDSNAVILGNQRRTERRKLREQLKKSPQSSPSPSANEISNNNSPSPPSPLAAGPPQQTNTVSRRQQIAERISKGKKVSIPRALLNPKQHTASTSSIAEEAAEDNKVSVDTSNVDTLGSPPESPTKEIPDTDKISTSPKTPNNNKSAAVASSPSSQHLILTPTNEVEMKLIEEEGGDASSTAGMNDNVTLPILESSPERNGARRNRRHLRKGKGVECGEGTQIVKQIEDGEFGSISDNIDQHTSSNGTDEVRSSSPISSFVSSTSTGHINPQISGVVARALDKARIQTLNTKEIDTLNNDDRPVNDDEAKLLFPQHESFIISSEMLSSTNDNDTPSINDAAWDASGASEQNAILDKSKVHNKEASYANDDQPLLNLETIVSDINATNDDTKEEIPEIAASKLLAQQERINMYNSGRFGEGEDSSVDVDNTEVEDDDGSQQNNEDMDDVNDSKALFDYEDMASMIDEDVDENDEDEEEIINEEDLGMFQLVQADEVPAFSPVGDTNNITDRVGRWDSNPDCMSDSSFPGTNNSDCGVAMLGLNSTRELTSTPIHEVSKSPFDLDPDATTPKIGTKGSNPRKSFHADSSGSKSSPAKVFKIPPPPSEKLREWEESKGITKTDRSPLKSGECSPQSADSGRPLSDSLNLKLHTPKSPKKKPHSLEEELDLANHKRFAEKIMLASSKAAKKFEEEYSNHPHSPGEEVSPSVGSSDRFFSCASKKSISPSASEPNLQIPTAGELVRGAFSPWKIPDRADDNESSIAASFAESERFAKAAGMATESIRGQHRDNDESSAVLNESFEVSLEEDKGDESPLTPVLRWLFNDVLPSDSSIVAAFSAFDINSATSVQCGRILAIINDDESFNIICRYVATSVMKQYGNAKIDTERQTEVPREIIDGNLDDTSVSTYDGSSIITTSSMTENNKPAFAERAAARILKRIVEPFQIPVEVVDNNSTARGLSSDALAANFASFSKQISNLTGVQSPFNDNNSFLQSAERDHTKNQRERKTVQELLFPDQDRVITIFQFLLKACKDTSVKHSLSAIEEDNSGDGKNTNQTGKITYTPSPSPTKAPIHPMSTVRKSNRTHKSSPRKSSPRKASRHDHNNLNPNFIVPEESPSPFETAVWNQPSIVPIILSFLGNPVSVCVMKRLNVFCNRIVCDNQHVLMRDAVRLGGMSKYVRPSFWLWVTEMNKTADPIPLIQSRSRFDAPPPEPSYKGDDFMKLKDSGAKGKWQPIIERDVSRAFGNMPPHKTGARYRQDSIVRALVSFGKEEIMRNSRSYQAMDKLGHLPEESEARVKHFKLSSRLDRRDDSSHGSSVTPTDTVSDWGGISPVGSLVSEEPSKAETANKSISSEPVITEESMRVVSYESTQKLDTNHSTRSLKLETSKSDVSDLVLNGNTLTSEMKVDLQDKLRYILHALAARHEAVGYCQGMDYVVAHLLRVLQDTILLRVVQRSNSGQSKDNQEGKAEENDWRTISSDELRARMSDINTHTVVVEEVVFRVMDTFFSTYNLQHMYWPELRCLKTCCRVFESLVKQKLPVLADHFHHYDLNVGLFALGWFQTLFLYLPSMPSATVCHIWDIWLVERSFKIFFRIGTAILFLSQPTLLNHDLEGMMTYLNTFPDATLLRRDILIPCALQIKITNKMLVEIELEVAKFNQAQSNTYFSE